jgi:hypothetical protein
VLLSTSLALRGVSHPGREAKATEAYLASGRLYSRLLVRAIIRYQSTKRKAIMTRETYPTLSELQLREGTPLFRLRQQRDRAWGTAEGYSHQIGDLEQRKQVLDTTLRRATIDTISVEEYAAAHAESELLGKTIAVRQQSKREAVRNAEFHAQEFQGAATDYANLLTRWRDTAYLSEADERSIRSALQRYNTPE